MSIPPLRIGSRGSILALWQARYIQNRLQENGVQSDLVIIKTTGDKILDIPLSKVGGKGLFVKELEDALLQRRIDLAVHSMKDMPSDLPGGLHVAVITEREDPRDALISSGNISLSDLPSGARIGTSSLRRQAQLAMLRTDIQFTFLRGNLDTRIKKLRERELDAIVLAAAGLHRLGWGNKITEYLSIDQSLPAVGQGALGIECRSHDTDISSRLLFLNDPKTFSEVTAERAMLARLEGGCETPIAGFASCSEDRITLSGLVASPDGHQVIRVSESGTASDPQRIGVSVAERLLSKGAKKLLKFVRFD